MTNEMDDVVGATQSDIWLLTLIDAGQHQQKQLEQRVQTLEHQQQLLNNKLTELIEVHNLCQKNNQP